MVVSAPRGTSELQTKKTFYKITDTQTALNMKTHQSGDLKRDPQEAIRKNDLLDPCLDQPSLKYSINTQILTSGRSP
jgi:hypothetical protein